MSSVTIEMNKTLTSSACIGKLDQGTRAWKGIMRKVECWSNLRKAKFFKVIYLSRGEWPSGLYSLRLVTEVKLGRVRSDFGWVTSED